MSVKNQARLLAFETLLEIIKGKRYANLAVRRALDGSDLSLQEKALVAELTYGTVRNQYKYSRIIAELVRKDVDKLDVELLVLLLMGAHQILNMRVKKYAAVNEMVNVAHKLKLHKFTGILNAVLRRVTPELEVELEAKLDGDDKLAFTFSCPSWILNEYDSSLKHWGRTDELEALLTANNTAPSVEITDLKTRCSRVLTSGNPASDPDIQQGTSIVQDSGSLRVTDRLITARIVDPEGEAWADFCAAPGGKALVLATFLEGNAKSSLTANELHPHRFRLLSDSMKRFKNVTLTNLDAREIPGRDVKFDRILLDAPCSGLGSIRRRQELRNVKTLDEVACLSALQVELFSAAVQSLKPGGLLLYSTCSPLLEETVNVVDAVLRTHTELEKIDEQQLWTHLDGTDSMYYCLLKSTLQQ
ncbi:MAG: hypothetical protein LBQ41_01255 [Candidatus Ancillula sp.]|jgi:16S rRNA (cytosine967-C5)-methyltransferase|nr:hypothetical protein [Candidatus Ancillula sp.]